MVTEAVDHDNHHLDIAFVFVIRGDSYDTFLILSQQKGVVRGTLMAVEHMRQDKGGKGGRIINISSEAAPDVKAQGIEYGTLCPGPVDTDLIRNLDETKIRHTNLMQPERLKERTSSVERLQEAFMKLVLLEEMNKAILYVDSKEENFYEMKTNNLGPTWPADSTDLSSQ
ncbi:15-hydroxyprostaglandin dehydrogenase [NAD(+)] [Plakobranchus ocellatus]|uniref:15-hydroxyprostaglandin dehydrogenase [NAD(+)] n=1 Tax=Plakobranchus ocellatus TaxID=259542 RepID=A0AAV3YFM6_9GAST|nr:15-hydroxyprostaglandin dehydrogenase [NAD(+)] [Plakobranchus ocellatus]